jgi:aspartate/methionine/tyrosine aminotransferase
MSDILLAKPQLPPDWIDVSVGEPHVVRDTLFKVFDLSVYELPKIDHLFEYPPSQGYKPLVQLLEQKHQAPVIITNGAKQGLGACFYALKQMKKERLGMRNPFWALIPPLAEMHGLKCINDNTNFWDSFLALSPNNPDGFIFNVELLKIACNLSLEKERHIPLIHDAAYYTHSYIDPSYQLKSFGDVQIYSISKMLGLSGLRLGYVVCPNKEFYTLILQYMEAMTVGVSMVSQVFLYDLMNRMQGYPTLTESFEGQAYAALQESKRIIKQVNTEILEVNSDIEQIPGMFGWFKVGNKADFVKSKINFINGDLFGVPGMVRMNLAFDATKMQEIVNRLNLVNS